MLALALEGKQEEELTVHTGLQLHRGQGQRHYTPEDKKR